MEWEERKRGQRKVGQGRKISGKKKGTAVMKGDGEQEKMIQTTERPAELGETEGEG